MKALALAILPGALCACVPPSPPMAPAPTVAAQSVEPGADLFAERCGACHGKGGMGTLLLARRKDGLSPLLEARNLDADQIKQIVRNGAGNMPPLTRGELSDADLEAIAEYLCSTKP